MKEPFKLVISYCDSFFQNYWCYFFNLSLWERTVYFMCFNISKKNGTCLEVPSKQTTILLIRTYIASVCIKFTLRLKFRIVNSSFVHKYGHLKKQSKLGFMVKFRRIFLSNLINFLLDNKYLICTIIEKTNKFVIT